MRRIALLVSACITWAAVSAGCANDGRELRPPESWQNKSISTTSSSTTSTLAGDGLVIGGGSEAQPNSVSGSGDAGPTMIGLWSRGGLIPVDATCDGQDLSPELSWSAAPEGTVEIAVGLIDENAVAYDHWLITGLAAEEVSIAQGAAPEGTSTARNSDGANGYTGPCPPGGTSHSYLFTVYYLSESLGDIGQMSVSEARQLAEERALSTASVGGFYTRR
jgi:Raf kinase inhibitor-like YbhB/YbcL family protein